MIHRQTTCRFRRTRRPGFVLILVLMVVAMLALSTYTFSSLMVTENEAALVAGQQLQTKALVDSGAAHVRYLLELEPALRESMGGIYSNPQLFQAQLVADLGTARSRARFGVVAPMMDESGYWGGMRFGLQDESSRLNLNALNLEIPDLDGRADTVAGDDQGGDQAGGGSNPDDPSGEDRASDDDAADIDLSGRAILLNLPGMTLEIADAILDWIDQDDQPREFGAEIEYYSSLTPPYMPQNGPCKTLEELLLVRGVTPDLLFGRDINRNGMIDVQEIAVPLQISGDPADGSMDLGWSAYLTLFSQEKNQTAAGEPRININQDDMQSLYDELSEVMDASWVTFIVAYRQFGPYDGESEDSQPASNQELDLTQPGSEALTQVLDLIGARVEMEVEGESIIVDSPFADNIGSMLSYLPTLMDLVTVNPAETIPGRININRAPRLVLLAIPGMTPEIVDSIISQRNLAGSEYDEALQHETWLLARAVVTLDEMRQLLPFVTAGGDVFRAQVVGYFDEGEISSRVEVVFDATELQPRILAWRDLSHLGRGYAREMLGISLEGNSQSTLGNPVSFRSGTY